jgi:CrcB protein
VSAATVVAVGLAGGCGAVARYAVGAAVAARARRDLPLGTLAVNLTGAFALGVVAGATLAPDVARIVGGGAIGAYTTFSTWAFESHGLGREGRARWGAANLVGSLLVGLLLAELGRRAGAWRTG